MRSRERFSNLAFRAASTAAPTCSQVWTRPIAWSSASLADCIPRDSRLKPASPQGAQFLPVPGGVRVGLQGDLRLLVQAVLLLDGFEQPDEPLGPQIAGRAAAEVHRVHLVSGGKGGGLRQMGAQRVGVVVHPVLTAGERVKVAVGALMLAEGDMDVKPQRLGGWFHSGSSQRMDILFSVPRRKPALQRIFCLHRGNLGKTSRKRGISHGNDTPGIPAVCAEHGEKVAHCQGYAPGLCDRRSHLRAGAADPERLGRCGPQQAGLRHRHLLYAGVPLRPFDGAEPLQQDRPLTAARARWCPSPALPTPWSPPPSTSKARGSSPAWRPRCSWWPDR